VKVLDRGYEQSAHLYDLFDSKDNVVFFYHYGAQSGEILDIGAGTGRIAIPLAERGVRLVCVEPSPAMRAQFEAKLDRRPELRERIRLVAADAASFDLGRAFPGALLSGSFDHLLIRAERLAAMKNIARHVEPGGWLVFDLFLGLMVDTPLSPAGEVQAGEMTYRRFVGSRTLPDRTLEVTLVYETSRGTVRLERVEQRSRAGITSRSEVHQLLAETGFSVQREFNDYQFTPFREGDGLLIVEATREA
jgi:SAM-dependent methyltransferase